MSLAYYIAPESRGHLVLLFVAPEGMAEPNDTMVARARPTMRELIVCFYYRPPPGFPRLPPQAMGATLAPGLRLRRSWNPPAGDGDTGLGAFGNSTGDVQNSRMALLYEVQPGDTVAKIARLFWAHKRPYLEEEFAGANLSLKVDPLHLQPDTAVAIPEQWREELEAFRAPTR